MKIARNVVVAVFVALFFLVACNPQPGAKIPSVNKLSSTEKTSLLKETIFAFEYGMTEMAGQDRSDDSLPGEHSFTLDAAYEAAYKAAVGNKPTYITVGTTLKVAFSTEDENIRISVSVEGSASISGEIEVAIVYDPITNTISYSINGSSIEAADIDFPDLGELLGPHESYFRIQFLTPGTQTVVHQFDLEYSISNNIALFEIDLEDIIFESLMYHQVNIMNHGFTSPDLFVLTPINRVILPNEMEEPLPSGITAALILIGNISGVGTYNITNESNYDEEDPFSFVTVEFMTNQIESNSEYYGAVLDSGDEQDRVIEITRYDEVGGYVAGIMEFENATLEFLNEDENQLSTRVYDVLIEFFIIRGENLLLQP